MSKIHGRVTLSQHPGGQIRAVFFPKHGHQTKPHQILTGGLEEMERDLIRAYQVTPAAAKSLIMQVSTMGKATVEAQLDEAMAKSLSAERQQP